MAPDPQPFPNQYTENDLGKASERCWLKSSYADVADESLHPRDTECWDCAWSPDKKYFIWSYGRRMVRVVHTDSIQSGRLGNPDESDMLTVDCRQIVTSVACGSSHGTAYPEAASGYRMFHWEQYEPVLAVGLRNGRIRLFDTKTGRITLELIDHQDCVTHMEFSPDNNLVLASSSSDGTVKFWDLKDDGNMMKTYHVARYTAHKGSQTVRYLAWAPDSRRVAAVGNFKTVVILDTQTQECVHRLHGHINAVMCCNFSPDGFLLVTAAWDTTAIVWNSHTGEIVAKLGHQFPAPSQWCTTDTDTTVRSCKFTADNFSVSTVAEDGYVRFWDLCEPECPTHVLHVEDCLTSCPTSDGSVLAVGTRSGSVLLIDVPQEVHSLVHLARGSVSKLLVNNYAAIESLVLPRRIKQYLKCQCLSV